MKRIPAFITGALLVFGLFASPTSAPANTNIVTPAEAVEEGVNAEKDHIPISIEGEAIGEALVAPDGKRWVNLRGGGLAIGVVTGVEEAASIPLFGEYGKRGATVRVTGTLQRACAEHGGDLDIHAYTFEVIDDGEILDRQVPASKIGLALAGAGIAAALLSRYRRLRRIALRA